MLVVSTLWDKYKKNIQVEHEGNRRFSTSLTLAANVQGILTLLSHDTSYSICILYLILGGQQTNQLHYWSSIVYLAACGETLNIDFTLPFNEFVPITCHTRFSLKVSESVYSLFQK